MQYMDEKKVSCSSPNSIIISLHYYSCRIASLPSWRSRPHREVWTVSYWAEILIWAIPILQIRLDLDGCLPLSSPCFFPLHNFHSLLWRHKLETFYFNVFLICLPILMLKQKHICNQWRSATLNQVCDNTLKLQRFRFFWYFWGTAWNTN